MDTKKNRHELDRLSPDQFRKADKMPLTVLLDNVRSMLNVGSVFRSADAFRVQQIILGGITPTPPHRDIQKTALGATETVQWSHSHSLLDTIQQLKQQGYTIAAVEQTLHSTSLETIPHKPLTKWAIVFGNEVEGVSEELLAICDTIIEIPQFGAKHSLNISVAAGIVLWEFAKNYYLNTE